MTDVQFCCNCYVCCCNLLCDPCLKAVNDCWKCTTCGGQEYICYDCCRIGPEPDDWGKVPTAARPGDVGYITGNPCDVCCKVERTSRRAQPSPRAANVSAGYADSALGDANTLPLLPLRMDRDPLEA